MAKAKQQIELEKSIRIANYHIILNMRDNGWCDGCKENVDDCLIRGKCKGQEDIENGKKTI